MQLLLRSSDTTRYGNWLRRIPLLQLVFVLLPGVTAGGAQLAFPGAEGYGRFASGGRGGAVIEVTNLNDSGAGSLRSAVAASGPRTIIFRISGTINLQSDLRVSNGNLTIAGQTAPGNGICLANYSLLISADNVIFRFIRVRVGDQGSADGADGRDAIFCRYTRDVIIDHCSFSWSIDEVASAYLNMNFTMQWCFITESLRNSLHSKSAHGYGGIWGGQYASFHHNLLAHHSNRNPRLNGSRDMPQTRNGVYYELERVDLRNNVIYNWGGNSAYAGEPRSDGIPSEYNFVGNYYKAGPATPSSSNDRIFNPTKVGGIFSMFHVQGNLTTANAGTTLNNWNGIDGPTTAEKAVMRRDTAFPSAPITQHDAQDAYEWVLSYGGCRYPVRDSIDARIVQEVRTGTFTYGAKGIIDSQSQVGGWPLLASAPAPADTDRDGMPDEWEIAHGLNPNDPADRNVKPPHGGGYTHLELYLNSLVHHLFPKTALNLKQQGENLQLTWSNLPNDSRLRSSPDLLNWADGPAGATGSAGTFALPSPAASSAVFYRMESGL